MPAVVLSGGFQSVTITSHPAPSIPALVCLCGCECFSRAGAARWEHRAKGIYPGGGAKGGLQL